MQISKFASILSMTTILLSLIFVSSFSVTFAQEINNWESDWAVENNFSISIDTEGYELPSAIAFVPNPGTGPKDPLYFVTELRGKIKVVANDRTVHTFAEDFFNLKPKAELPFMAGEVGMAGICLDSLHGYVFVTFTYQDSNNILRNNIVRFDSKPGTFSLKPSSMLAFTEIFSGKESSPSHQIGACQIYDDLLYVSVGDAHKQNDSQSLDSILGKVIRMSLDGKPVESNPYYVDDDVKRAINYVWAYGFRNPFGLKIAKGRVFVAENGKSADRFLEIHEGENYLWDGTDWSIGTNANVVFAPSVGPVQLDYCPEDVDIFPEEYRGKFYLALGGEMQRMGPAESGGRSIVMLYYDFNENRMLSVPKHLLKYRAEGRQLVAGLGIGPDGLYFVPLFPDSEGRSAVLKVVYEEGKSHPYTLEDESNPAVLFQDYGCLGCHELYGEGYSTVGPSLDRDPMISRIRERLDSPEYTESVTKLDLLEEEPYNGFRDARKDILEKQGVEKVRAWIKYHLLEPKFDNPNSQMPNLGLSDHVADLLTSYLLEGKSPQRFRNKSPESFRNRLWITVNNIIPELRYRYLLYSFMLGFVLPLFLVGVALFRWKKR